jgi:dienelactone hydrolase
VKRILKLAAVAVVAGAIATVAVLAVAARQANCRRRTVGLQRQAQLAREAGDLAAELEASEALFACNPDDRGAAYDLGCSLARAGESGRALEMLEKAAQLGFDDAAWARADADLDALKGSPGFGRFLAAAERNEREGIGPAPPPPSVEGVRVVEDRAEGGFRYRLYLPPTRDGEPFRLVVWMHGGGSLGEAKVEPLAPLLAKEGFALLVPLQKFAAYWTDRDAAKLFDRTVPAAASHGVRADAVVALGFSAGGQSALRQWSLGRKGFAGLALSSAFPVEVGPRGYQLMKLSEPRPAPIKVFALVGGEEGLHDSWWEAREKWGEAATRFEVFQVPGRRHGWLFDDDGRRRGLVEFVKGAAWPGEPTAGH